MSTETKVTYRDRVAEEMLEHIEKGTAPWQKPWKAGVFYQRPFNPVSNKPYHGINAVMLDMAGHEDPRWMTYRQASALGAQVRKGEKSRQIEYWQWGKTQAIADENGKVVLGEDGKPKTQTVRLQRPVVFHAFVFNAEQIDGLEPYKAPPLQFDPVEKAEAVLAQSGILIRHGQNDEAFYNPMLDTIHLPSKEAFPTAYDYYATALHEVGHGTGHRSRMNREFGPFGSEVYAKEELRAEMASYMVSRELGLGHNPERHAGYVEGWAKAIKEDKNFIFQAALDADRIATWIQEPEKRQALEQAMQDKARGRDTVQESRENVMRQEPLEADRQPSVGFGGMDAAQGETQGKTDRQPSVGFGGMDAAQKAQPEKADRQYLAVPYAEKDQAKALGAKWDRQAKSWYAPEGADLGLAKWAMDKAPSPTKDLDPSVEFAVALEGHGLKVEGKPIMDGEWHRAALDGDPKGKQNASYRGFLDGVPNGQIKNFKTGELHNWTAVGVALTDEQRASLKAEAAHRKSEHRQELKTAQEAAAKKAYGVWKNAPGWASQENSEYLKRKGVDGFGVKVAEDGKLIIPARDVDGKIHSLQFVGPDGKSFIADGRKGGMMHVIDPQKAIGTSERIVIAEGYATAATVHQATGYPTIAAFDSGNLKAVGEAVRKKYGFKVEIVFAADNDHRNVLEGKPGGNVGLNKATEAAQAVGGKVIMPLITPEEASKGLSDWNDVMKANPGGLTEVSVQIEQQLRTARELSPPKVKPMAMKPTPAPAMSM